MDMSWTEALDYALSGFGPQHGFGESVRYVNRVLLIHNPLIFLMPVNVYFWSQRLRKYSIGWLRSLGRWIFYGSCAFVPWWIVFGSGRLNGGPEPWIVAQSVTKEIGALLGVHLLFALTAWQSSRRGPRVET